MKLNVQITYTANCTNYGEHNLNMLREDMEEQILHAADKIGYDYSIDAVYVDEEGDDDLIKRSQQVVAELSQLRKELVTQELKDNKVDPKKIRLLMERYMDLLG